MQDKLKLQKSNFIGGEVLQWHFPHAWWSMLQRWVFHEGNGDESLDVIFLWLHWKRYQDENYFSFQEENSCYVQDVEKTACRRDLGSNYMHCKCFYEIFGFTERSTPSTHYLDSVGANLLWMVFIDHLFGTGFVHSFQWACKYLYNCHETSQFFI